MAVVSLLALLTTTTTTTEALQQSGPMSRVASLSRFGRDLHVAMGGPPDSAVNYLSSLSDKPKGDSSAPKDPRDQVQQTEAVNAGPANYDGFVDAADGFDGGDGQVGVVGDGTNAMEEYDMSEKVKQRRMNAVGGSESKQTRSNVWGYTTGYAEDLKKRGMVDVDEFGEDRLSARRQQLENWRNQHEVRLQKEAQTRDLYNLQGKSYQPNRHGSYLSQMENQNAKPDLGPADRHVLSPGPRIDGSLLVNSRLNQRGGVTVSIQNEYSTYADFLAGFAPGSADEIRVQPSSGTLNRRGGKPIEFVVTFEPQNLKDDYSAVLVIQTEDHTWTYQVQGRLQ